MLGIIIKQITFRRVLGKVISRIGYCTVFSLQRDVPDLRISISGSYHFEFQKMKNIKLQKFEILFQFAYTRRYLTENIGTALYLAVQTDTGPYLTDTISNINVYHFLTGMVRYSR